MNDWSPPTTLAELRLPPSFVADHCIRTLSYQGPLTPAEIARHWRVHDAIVAEVVEALKAAGLVRLDAGQSTFDRLGRVRLSDAGQARVLAARQRTWYAGALPVSLAAFGQRLGRIATDDRFRDRLASELGALAFDAAAIDGIGQAVAAGAAVTLDGIAPDEQIEVADALGRALSGIVTLPYAVFAAGSVIRLFDARYHRTAEAGAVEDDGLDVLRSHREATQWASVARPAVTLTGGLLASDVLPAYDDEAHFYVAPVPLAASGGVLCITDCGSSADALSALARLWLSPGRHGAGIVLLRSGERIEVPWHAATVLLDVAPQDLPDAARRAIDYNVDASALADGALVSYISRRLGDTAIPEQAAASVAELLKRTGLGSRRAAADACRYLRDRAAYEGASFSLSPAVLEQAIDFAAREEPARLRRAA